MKSALFREITNVDGEHAIESKQFLLVKLELNYRSDRLICEAANRLIAHNENRVKKETISASDSDGTVSVSEALNADGEMMNVLLWLRQLAGTSAILLRTNHLVDEWTKFLSGQGVEIARKQTTTRPEDWPFVKLAIGLLNDPENDWLAYWFIRSKHGQAKADSGKLSATAAGQSLNTAHLNIPHDLSPIAYGPILARLGVSSESLAIVQKAIDGLGVKATGTELTAALAADENHEEEIGQGVVVTTYHSAKGREWDQVFLVACEEEIIPGTAKSRSTEEERRLFYVGMTRARHRLFISHCQKRKPQFGSWTPVPGTPSRFIKEAGL